ncbi:MAG: hypothetical protein AABZ47_14745 [Planctomycetota bacterium]
MKWTKTSLWSLVATLALVVSVQAYFCPEHDQKTDSASAKSGGGSPCQGHGTAATASDKPGCGAKKCCKDRGQTVTASAEAVLASLPGMKYQIGSETTNCPNAAEAMAIKTSAPIKYIVADKTFEGKGEATVALAAVLETELQKLTTVQMLVDGESIGCPHAAKEAAKNPAAKVAYRVGGFNFTDKAKADEAATLASAKAAEVKMTYKVGDASFCCDKMAGAKVKESGGKMTYVVNGEETCCNDTAKLLLAQAKILAIVQIAAGLSA